MPLARPLFAILLLLSSLVTAFLGARTLFAPEAMMKTFGVPASNIEHLSLMIAVLGGVLLSLAAVVLLAAWWSLQNRPEGRTLGMLCAATLILVAVCAYAVAGSTQILLLDGIRGIVLLALGFAWKPQALPLNRG